MASVGVLPYQTASLIWLSEAPCLGHLSQLEPRVDRDRIDGIMPSLQYSLVDLQGFSAQHPYVTQVRLSFHVVTPLLLKTNEIRQF